MSKISALRGKGIVKAPTGLIIGVATAATLPSGWENFVYGENHFIRGTIHDSGPTQVATGVAGNGITISVGSSGGHLGSPARDCEIGTGSPCKTNCKPHSVSSVIEGSHSGHTASFSFYPNRMKLRLIRATGNNSWIFGGGIMFSGETNEYHSRVSYLEDYDGMLMSHGSETVRMNGWTPSVSVTGKIDDTHDHIELKTSQVSYIKPTNWTTVHTSGGSHLHSLPVPSQFVYNPKHITMRAYHVNDLYNIKGLIGMWPYAGAIPTGWQLVTEADDNFIKFDSTPNMTSQGNDTIYIAGETGTASHSHPYGSGSTINREVSYSYHHDGVAHTHGYISPYYFYKPIRVHFKFIRYVGY